MSTKAQEAFAKVENLRSQHPNESNAALCKRAGVSTISFYKGKKLSGGGGTMSRRGNQKLAAQTKTRRPRKAKSEPKLVPTVSWTAAPNKEHLALIMGTPEQIRTFLAGA